VAEIVAAGLVQIGSPGGAAVTSAQAAAERE